jgi:hypothetical protein
MLNRNDIKTELYRLISNSTITDEQAIEIFDKSYENQHPDQDILDGVSINATTWVQQKITELGF